MTFEWLVSGKSLKEHATLMKIYEFRNKHFPQKERTSPLVIVYDATETALIANLLKPDMVFVDCGANLGYYTRIASKLVGPKGKVYAFEPTNNWFRILKKNTAGLGNVRLYNAAVGNANGEGVLYINKQSQYENSLVNKSDLEQKTKIVRLDSIINRADIVKIDVEGAELGVLEGMGKLLDLPNIKLLVEYNHSHLSHTTKNYNGTIRLLRKKGFQLHQISANGYLRTPITDYKQISDWSVNLYCYKGSDNESELCPTTKKYGF
jgi:FkbM family methyltransferase